MELSALLARWQSLEKIYGGRGSGRRSGSGRRARRPGGKHGAAVGQVELSLESETG
jgi:hypothetical protein